MIIGRRLRLFPDKEQETKFRQFAGCCRSFWNLSIDYIEGNRDSTTDALDNLYNYYKELKNTEQYAYLKEVPARAISMVARDLGGAYKTFFKSLKKKDKGDSYNKYKPNKKIRGKCVDSFYDDEIKKTDDVHLKVSKIDTPVKCKALKYVGFPEKLHNPRIIFDGKFWYLAYGEEIDDNIYKQDIFKTDKLGIDLGIKSTAVCSTGKTLRNVNKDDNMKKMFKRLKHLSRKLNRQLETNWKNIGSPKNSKGYPIYKGCHSKNTEKTKKEIRLLYRRITNYRNTEYRTFIKEIIDEINPARIVIEDLKVSNMLKNSKLAHSISQQSWGNFRRILEYKGEWYGFDVKKADTYFASSQICSICGYRNKDVKDLRIRKWNCPSCGSEHDRDVNAAVNLMKYTEEDMIKETG